MGAGENGVEARRCSARCAEEDVDAIYGPWFNGAGVASKWNCCMFYPLEFPFYMKEAYGRTIISFNLRKSTTLLLPIQNPTSLMYLLHQAHTVFARLTSPLNLFPSKLLCANDLTHGRMPPVVGARLKAKSRRADSWLGTSNNALPFRNNTTHT